RELQPRCGTARDPCCARSRRRRTCCDYTFAVRASRTRTLEETTTRRISGYVRGRDRRRSGDLTLFRRALCQLSYPALFTGRLALRLPFGSRAVLTGFEPAASAL